MNLRNEPPNLSQKPSTTRRQPPTIQPPSTNPRLAAIYAPATSANNQQSQAQHIDRTVAFLVQQMQQMQVVQQQILQALKTQPWQWGAPTPQEPHLQQQGLAHAPTNYIK